MVTAAPWKINGERAEEVKQSPSQDYNVIEIKEYNYHLGSVANSCKRREAQWTNHGVHFKHKINKPKSMIGKVVSDIASYYATTPLTHMHSKSWHRFKSHPFAHSFCTFTVQPLSWVLKGSRGEKSEELLSIQEDFIFCLNFLLSQIPINHVQNRLEDIEGNQGLFIPEVENVAAILCTILKEKAPLHNGT